MEKETRRIIETYDELEAIYVTNAYVKPACKVISELAPGRIRVFCHERFDGIEAYLMDGRITATIDQQPFQLWYNALMTMGNYLLYKKLPDKQVSADCRLLTRETIPLVNPAGGGKE